MNAFQPLDPDKYHERLMVVAMEMLKPLIAKRLAKVKRNGVLPDSTRAIALAHVNSCVDRRFSTSLLNQRAGDALWRAVRSVLEQALAAPPNVVGAVANELHKQRHKLDVLLQSPPPARPTPKKRKRVPKLPLREQRAADAVAKLRAWERKQKIAVTKIKALRKKVHRYQSLAKKGSNNDDAV